MISDLYTKRQLRLVRRFVLSVGSGVIVVKGRLRPVTLADLAYDVMALRYKS